MKQHKVYQPSDINGDVLALHEMAIAPQDVFAALADAPNWVEWLPLTKVEWLSAPQNQAKLGARRMVTAGRLKFEEEFFIWEDGGNDGASKMAFYFAATNVPFMRGAYEEYAVYPAHDGRSRVTWKFDCDMPWPLKGIFTAQISKQVRQGLVDLEKYLDHLAAK